MYLKYRVIKVSYQFDMILDPKHLSILHTIRETGGLTAAANEIGTSQPALSRLLANMEIRLGAQVFDRSTRPWRLTPLGESLALQGGAVQTAVSRASDAIENFRVGTEGVIRLGGSPYLCDAVLPSIITAFQTQMPDACVEQSHAYITQLLVQLQRWEVDLVVAPVDTADITGGLESRRLLAAKNIIACSNNHPLAAKPKVDIRQLLDYRWIAPPADSPLATDMRDILNVLDVQEFNTAFSGGALNTVVQMLEESDCLALLPTYVLKKLRARYALTSVNISLPTPTRSIMLVSNADVEGSNLQRSFADFIEQAFKELGAEIEIH